jgi:hypothetical protein
LPARLVTENLGRRISGRTDLDPAVPPVLDQFYLPFSFCVFFSFNIFSALSWI